LLICTDANDSALFLNSDKKGMAEEVANGYRMQPSSLMKRVILKRLMRLFERIPRADDYHLNEIFRHKSFTEANEEERETIMLKSSEWAYMDESHHHAFESYFKFDFARLLKGQVALDLGCFTGGRAVAWAEHWQLKKIYGIDIQDIHIKAAQNFAERRCVNAEFVCAKGEKLPFEGGTFDAVLSFDVFEHVQDPKQVLLECHRVLREHGRLFLAFPSYFGPVDHHLSLVTLTPFVHVIFNKKDVIAIYNEIIDERGDEASWYKRQHRDLEPWEQGNTINGTTARKFRHMIKDMNWNIVAEHHLPILGGMSKKYPVLKLIRYIIIPLARLPGFEECLSTRIVYILEKP
jgi:ubiquinone/menaquinone biosynthesis C-methylase UbiE